MGRIAVADQPAFDLAAISRYKPDVSDELFPSGAWTAFYHYRPQERHRMDLHLTFASGQVRGDGNDDVGPFVIRGEYDAVSGECDWLKTYSGSHAVFYHGFREGKGIWGRWDIGLHGHGGFHIWPRNAGEGEAQAATMQRGEPRLQEASATLFPSRE